MFSEVTVARTETTSQVSQRSSCGTCALVTLLGKDCENSKNSCRKIIFASMFNDITSWESHSYQAKCRAPDRKSSYLRSKIQTWLLVFLWSKIRKTVEIPRKKRPHHMFAGGGWDILALRMINELLRSKHPAFKFWNILQTGLLMRRRKSGARTHFKNEP